MRHYKNNKPVRWCLVVLCWVCFATTANADSSFLTPSEGYRVDDYLTDKTFDAFSMFDQDTALLCSAEYGFQTVNLYSGEVEADLGGLPQEYISSNINPNDGMLYLWASFVEKSPIDDTYWVGFTNYGDSDDRIYQVSSDGNWTHRATLMCNFDLKFSGTNMLVSANPGGVDDTLNQIVLLDTSGNDDHAVLVNIGGYSSGLGIGVNTPGDIYYATYLGWGSSENQLLRFASDGVQTALDGGPTCELADADVLYDIPLGAYDTEVDAADHVVFNGNGPYPTPGCIWLWDEETPTELTTIATCTTGDWLGNLDVEGDLLEAGGSVYATAWGRGVTKITKLIPGDANGDGKVDGSDVTILAGNWQADGMNWAAGDFNSDGKVDGSDVTILAGNWQASLWDTPSATTATAVPEPSVVALLAVLVLIVGLRGRRSVIISE